MKDSAMGGRERAGDFTIAVHKSKIADPMSYTVLARRYRSGTFDEVIGQDHVAQTLKKAIDAGRIAHAYLFCGTRGTGKTSMARILAKALNCSNAKGPTIEPCGKCESCQAIARGDDIDVIEIDAASNTGVDNIREVIENAQYRPARSRFKVYIIDEVHMLSKSAFNALLKTLEEPPGHVKFILATTEPEKVLPTILSRCQRYDFRNIPTREIAAHLKEICSKEKIKADEDALMQVAKAGAGSMRDALSLLDRLLSVGEKHLTSEMVEQLLGLPRTQLLFDLANAIGSADVKGTLGQADSILNGGLSVDALIGSLTDHLRNLLILRTCGPDSTLVEVPGLAMKDLVEQADRFDPVALTQDITILEELRRNIRQSQAGRALLDATLVRMALADQFSSIGDLLSRLDGSGAPSPKVSLPIPAATAPSQKKNSEPVRTAVTEAAAAPQSAPAIETAVADSDDDDDDLPRPGKVWSGPSLATLLNEDRAKPTRQPEPAATAESNVETVDPSNLPAVWQAAITILAAQGPVLPSLLTPGKLVSIEDGRAVVRYAAQHDTFVKMLERNGKKDLVRETLSNLLKESVGVKFEVDAEAVEAMPAMDRTRPSPPQTAPARPASAPLAPQPAVKLTPELIESLRKEPLVRAFMDEMGAQIVKVE
jgi:DNA polymerase-3 subunit gamma/tau